MIRLYSIEGNRQKLDGGAMFGNAPRPVWSKWCPVDDLGRIELACRALLADIHGTKVLCETGIGAFFEPKLAERFGVQEPTRHMLLENLSLAGFKEEDIDYVILSHLHFDHAGGLLPTYQDIQQGRDGLLFPRARYIVGAEALARAKHPHLRDRASFIPDLPEKLARSGRLQVVTGERIPGVLPEVSFLVSHGHTPGHLHTLIQGEASKVLFCGDLIPGVPWIHTPITMGYDRFPEKVIDEKENLYKMTVPYGSWLFFTHDLQAAAAKIETHPNGRVTAIDLQKEWVGYKC